MLTLPNQGGVPARVHAGAGLDWSGSWCPLTNYCEAKTMSLAMGNMHIPETILPIYLWEATLGLRFLMKYPRIADNWRQPKTTREHIRRDVFARAIFSSQIATSTLVSRWATCVRH